MTSETESTTIDPREDRLARLRAVRDHANSTLVEREVEIDLILLSLLSKQNGLLIGEPGVAKSQTIRAVLSRIEGAKKFEVLLGQATPPAAVLGPVSVRGLTEDRYTHITTGMLPESNVGFLDEIFKCNSVTLNALLSIVNERVFHNGGQPVEIPLWSVIGASNELPTEVSLAAFRDRLPWTRKVEAVKGDEGFKRVMMGNILRRKNQAHAAGPDASVSIKDFEEMQKEVTEIEVTDVFLDSLSELRHRAEKEGMTISARRFASGIALCQANAFISGRTKLVKTDLVLFEHILWLDPQDIPKAYEIASEFAGEVQRAVGKLSSSLSELVERFDGIRDRLDSTDQTEQSAAMTDGVNILADMKRLSNTLERTQEKIVDSEEEDGSLLKDLENKIYEWRTKMRKEIM